MRRTIWFSLTCPIGLVGLVSVRSIRMLASNTPIKISDDFQFERELPAAMKTDKLSDSESQGQREKVAVQTVKIAPESPPAKEAPETSKQQRSPAYV